jgi:hypothetical protein
MNTDQLQGKKHEKEKLEYTVLDEITENKIPKEPKNKKCTTTGAIGTSNSCKCG